MCLFPWVPCRVPESALEMNFAFTNGGQVWDSNGGHNYQATVMPPGLPPGVTARPRCGSLALGPCWAGGVRFRGHQGGELGVVSELRAVVVAGGVAARRRVESEQALPHGAGTMHILSLAKRDKGDPGYSKQGRWIDEKLVRVWTPPGWEPDK